jgi:ubiquinone/menaquinone biosynthesis C-methylase UbiE
MSTITEPSAAENHEQRVTTRRYDRNAFLYDTYDRPMDLLGGVRAKRKDVLGRSVGRVLEVGVGTGRNLDLYPPGIDLTGVDLSEQMLARAHRRARRLGADVALELADIVHLPFADHSFATVTATCVFCSVADPIRGLTELRRVVARDGQVLLLEHVRPRSRIAARIFDLANPVVRRVIGANINRSTEDNVRAAGLKITNLRSSGVWREIIARPAANPTNHHPAPPRRDEEEPA